MRAMLGALLVACGGGSSDPIEPVPTGVCVSPEEGWAQTVYADYGEPRTVGQHELEVAGQGGRCPDWYVATARIGGWHR